MNSINSKTDKLFNREEYQKKLDALANELQTPYICFVALKELKKLFDENYDVYQKYNQFLYYTYYAYYDQLIHSISKLIDTSKGSLSIIKILNSNIQINDERAKEEQQILSKIESNPTYNKLKTIRNKLNRAHIDGKIAINIEEQSRTYEENKLELIDIEKYTLLLTKALEALFLRLDISITLFKPNVSIKKELQELFKNLKATKKD